MPASPIVFVVPGSIDTRTGGSIYDRRLAGELARLGWVVHIEELPGDFPFPDSDALSEAAARFATIPDGSLVLVDGLALAALPDLAIDVAQRARLIALVHLPVAADTTLGDDARRFDDAERRALAAAELVVATGSATLSLLMRHGVAPHRIVVVEPGTDPSPLACGSADGVPHLVTVGTLHPGKGHLLLVEALAPLADRRWRLTCAGSLTRHPPTVRAVEAAITAHGFDKRMLLAGDLDGPRLARLYAAADVFVLATYQETYGMAVAEALAHGLPVIATATGAIPALVGESAGLVVPPGDRSALTAALARVLDDGAYRAQLADGARRVRERLPTWSEAARRLVAALTGLHAHG